MARPRHRGFDGGMQRAPVVEVTLGPSRIACAWIALVAVAAMAVVFALPVAPWTCPVAGTALLAWARYRIRGVALRCAPSSVRRLRVGGDRALHVFTADGRMLHGHVLASTFVGARLTTVVWRRDGSRWSRAEWVLPDMLPAEDFRRLRVQLRYSRSEVAAARSPSHA